MNHFRRLRRTTSKKKEKRRNKPNVVRREDYYATLGRHRVSDASQLRVTHAYLGTLAN